MAEKISKAEVRRLLPPGTCYMGEFVGTNAQICSTGMKLTLRKVIKQTQTQMVSEFLGGPKQNSYIYGNWDNVECERDGEDIILYQLEYRGVGSAVVTKREAYLKITPYEQEKA